MNDEREQMGDRIQVLPPPKAKPEVMPPAKPQDDPWRLLPLVVWATRILLGLLVLTCLVAAAAFAKAIGFF
jgi:hypothetical protein